MPPVAVPRPPVEPKKTSKYLSLSEKTRVALPRVREMLLALRNPLLDEIQSSCSYSHIVEAAVTRFEAHIRQNNREATRA